MIRLGYSRQSKPSALRVAEASDGQIVAVRSSDCDINWGRRHGSGLNPDTSNAVHKRKMREIFAAHEVPSPRLYTPQDAIIRADLNALTDSPVTMIGRPDRHTRRRGYWEVETFDQVNTALQGRGRKKAATHFMEKIYMEREFRVHVFKGKSLRISEKLFNDEGKYTTIKPTLSRRKHIREAAKQAVEALGLDFGTVDILADEDRAYVLEVNTAPGVGPGGTMPKVWADAFINHFTEEVNNATGTHG